MKSELTALIIALAVMFALVGAASAGNGTAGNPYTVLYIGYTYDGSYSSMAENYSGTYSVISPSARDPIYYNTTYADIDYGYYPNYLPSTSDLNAATALVAAGGYDYLIVDMVFIDNQYVNPSVLPSYTAFYNACNNVPAAVNTASIFADDGTNSYAPINFDFRDNLSYMGYPPYSTVALRFQNAVDHTDPWNPDYLTFLKYLN